MSSVEGILKPFSKVLGGARLPHNKNTADSATTPLLAPDRVILPVIQHIGAPCVPVVKKGDAVFVGTKIADSDAPVSAPIHSSVSGRVVSIEKVRHATGVMCDAVIIENDRLGTPAPSLAPHPVSTPEELVKAARESGLVGLGGAGFPTHVKLQVSPDRPLDTLIVNGAECEPYITSDYRECIECPDDILGGIYLIKDILGLRRVIIGVEDDKPAAIDVLYKIAADRQDKKNEVRLMKLRSHYPQGAEKVLIYTTTGIKVPAHKLPADVGCIVMNITSVAALFRFIKTGMPLVSRRITVDGNAVNRPRNVMCPIGTPIDKLLDFCGAENPEKVIMGGPMMGMALSDISVPVLKQNNAILAFKGRQAEGFETTNCISCGRCVKACPMFLRPRAVETAVEFKKGADTFSKLGADYCIECGSCAYSCPARRPLVQAMRLAKSEIRKAGAK